MFTRVSAKEFVEYLLHFLMFLYIYHSFNEYNSPLISLALTLLVDILSDVFFYFLRIKNLVSDYTLYTLAITLLVITYLQL